MRLAIVRKRFTPYGGAERFILTAAGALIAAGETVTVITENWQGGTVPGLDCRLVPRRGLTRATRQRAFQHGVAAALAAGGFDLVQSHERVIGADLFRAGDGVHAAWVDRLGRERGALGRALLALDPMHRLVMATERAMAADPRTTFIANSRLVARELSDWLGLPPDRLRLIENGVDLDRFRPADTEEKAAARRALGLPESRPLIAFVGSGYARKGAWALLEAMRRPQLAEAGLVVAGHDRKLADFRRAIARRGLGGRVTSLGAVDDVRPLLAAADVFALPSLYDPMPNAALEAIAAGLPVVATADTGIADHLAESGAGLVAGRAPDEIADAVARCFVDRDHHAAAARALRSVFDLGRATDRWRALYRELAGTTSDASTKARTEGT